MKSVVAKFASAFPLKTQEHPTTWKIYGSVFKGNPDVPFFALRLEMDAFLFSTEKKK
jgi:predicted nucleic acid-binding protein